MSVSAGVLLREHRRALMTVVGLHALAAAAGLAAPYVVGRLVDEVTGGTAYATVDRLALWLAAAILCQTVLGWAAGRASFRLGDDVVHAAFGEGVVTGVEPGGGHQDHLGANDLEVWQRIFGCSAV